MLNLNNVAIDQFDYAKLTQAQKDAYNAGTFNVQQTPVAPPPPQVKEPFILDGERYEDKVKEDIGKLQGYLNPPVINPEKPPMKADATVTAPSQPQGGLSYDETKDLYGEDFTGIKYDQTSGRFFPDASAESRRNPLVQEAQNATAEIDRNYQSAIELIDSQMRNLTRSQQSELESIKTLYSQRRAEMRDLNQRTLGNIRQVDIRLGTSQYAPTLSNQLLSSEEQAGFDRIQEIDAAERSALAAAEEAFNSKNYELMSSKIATIEANRKAKQEELTAQLQRANEFNKNLLEEKKLNAEAEKAAREEEKATIDSLAFGIGDMLTGDDSDMQMVADIARQYGNIDANKLYFAAAKARQDKDREQIKSIQGKAGEFAALKEYLPGFEDLDFEGYLNMVDPTRATSQMAAELGLLEKKYNLEKSQLDIQKTQKEIAGMDDEKTRKTTAEAIALSSKYQADWMKDSRAQKFDTLRPYYSAVKELLAERGSVEALKDTDVGIITAALARFERPDITRAAIDADPYKAQALDKQAEEYKAAWLEDKGQLPAKVADALATMNTVWKTTTKDVSKWNKEFTGQLKAQGVEDVYLPNTNEVAEVTVNGQKLKVGSIVQNDKTGKKGRVEADGTITPI